LGFLGLLFLAILFFGLLQPLVVGLSLRHSILKEIAGAKEIRVVEHSNTWDDMRARRVPIKPNWTETVYATVILNQSQISQLRAALSPALDYSSLGELMCIFDSHHRIEIRRHDDSVYTMEICFVCGELVIDNGRDRIFPVGWGPKLTRFISSLSLHPNGPWDEKRIP
jgi:hypothetical protein